MLLGDIHWDDDTHFTLHGHQFRFVSHAAPGGVPAPPADAFNVYKARGMLTEYNRILQGRPVDTIVELGIFHGGSAVLFNELLAPRRLVAVDLAPRSPSTLLDQYAATHAGVELHWGVNQADRPALTAAVGTGPLDLVIDDASHYYDPTLDSFDILFPQLRPGGLYVIEDWAWPFQPHLAEHGRFRTQRSLSDVIGDLAGLKACNRQAIGHLEIANPFLVIERGRGDLTGLDVRRDVYRRTSPNRNSTARLPRRIVGRALRALHLH